MGMPLKLSRRDVGSDRSGCKCSCCCALGSACRFAIAQGLCTVIFYRGVLRYAWVGWEGRHDWNAGAGERLGRARGLQPLRFGSSATQGSEPRAQSVLLTHTWPGLTLSPLLNVTCGHPQLERHHSHPHARTCKPPQNRRGAARRCGRGAGGGLPHLQRSVRGGWMGPGPGAGAGAGAAQCCWGFGAWASAWLRAGWPQRMKDVSEGPGGQEVGAGGSCAPLRLQLHDWGDG